MSKEQLIDWLESQGFLQLPGREGDSWEHYSPKIYPTTRWITYLRQDSVVGHCYVNINIDEQSNPQVVINWPKYKAQMWETTRDYVESDFVAIVLQGKPNE